ncbi:transposase [Desulfosediminicola sp.]|uniref:transposase n=1 Tax=Desulfosediminicola sp. TaxID=2886825 RepID=UPI003AF2648F
MKGFPEAIEEIFPETEVQLRIVHQIRNSLKHAPSRNHKEFLADLKWAYQTRQEPKMLLRWGLITWRRSGTAIILLLSDRSVTFGKD